MEKSIALAYFKIVAAVVSIPISLMAGKRESENLLLVKTRDSGNDKILFNTLGIKQNAVLWKI